MNQQDKRLIEWVRLLEEAGQVFAADPVPITQALQQEKLEFDEKLLKRATMMDAKQELRDVLSRHQQWAKLALLGLTLLWLVLGFASTALLLQQAGQNFFLLLLSVLGVNSLTFVLWLLLLSSKKTPSSLLSPALWLRPRQTKERLLLQVYRQEWQKDAIKWFVGKSSHRFWLASLTGMLLACLLLLSVRQYTFNWESTILPDGVLLAVVQGLAWLPDLLGFAVPSAEQITASRVQHHIVYAREWSSLLLASLILYGILPRLLAFLFCAYRAKKAQIALDFSLPYYQKLQQAWQKVVVDADTQQEKKIITNQLFELDEAAEKWAVLLERTWHDARWFAGVLGQNWRDDGVLADRIQLQAYVDKLVSTKAQLLLGVSVHAVPDRGALRQIVRLQEASAGVMVQLLAEQDAAGGSEHAVEQWQNALNEWGVSFLLPARYAQNQRV
ncbi:MAG: DUF2868 domain-containing protein [Neisseria sp.]|nr:DUF2868 domain-containing protein [Neisseria sp.]